ncbi:MAG: CRISPR-associated helicase/endonuclease Cas3, partial [Rectinema sp.]|nr:CRISPR-associated helicase/endonuclease Cas3 [Rectinema sp.]
ELYWIAHSLDAKDIMKLLSLDREDGSIQFRSAAEAFRIIDDSNQKTILVPYAEGEELIRILKARGPERWLMRRLQRYSINIYTNDFFSLLNRGSIEEVSTGIFALSCSIEYDNTVGLLINEMPHEPEAFIVI